MLAFIAYFNKTMAKTATLNVNEADLRPRVHDVIGTGIAMERGPKRSGGVQRDEGGGDLRKEGRLHARTETLHVALQQEHLLGEALHLVGNRPPLGDEGVPQPREAHLLPDRVRVEGTQARGIAEERLDGVGLRAVQARFD